MHSTSTRALNRIELQVDLNYEVSAPGADFVFNVHAAHTPNQRLSAERLVLNRAVESQTHTDPATRNRYLRAHAAPGTLALSYAVTVDLMHRRSDPAQLAEVPIGRLPPEVLGYLYPNRYCQSDRLLTDGPPSRAGAPVEGAARGGWPVSTRSTVTRARRVRSV